MGKFNNRIININDILYECLGSMSVDSSEIKGTDYWKKQWNADSVLRSNNEYYCCRIIVDAEFEDI